MACRPVGVVFCRFFFQAEDGIRDYKVTGVQTCALPISCRSRAGKRSANSGGCGMVASVRSEERRVGKGCRSGGARHDEKETLRRPIAACAGENKAIQE